MPIETSTIVPKKITLLKVAGVCHGPEKYARSPIHDMVASQLETRRTDVKTLFIPSTTIHQVTSTQIEGKQMPPSYQLELIRQAVDETKSDSRIPIALAHSSGSIATLAALREGSLPYAIFVSPTFLDPQREIFYSNRFRNRLGIIRTDDQTMDTKIGPRSMGYETVFPSDLFDDPLYAEPLAGHLDELDEVSNMLRTRARIFIGTADWNKTSYKYPALFPVELVGGETHSFEASAQSPMKITNAILDLIPPTNSLV